MGFKDFLLEYPHFVSTEKVKINCPYGDIIDISNYEKYGFDYGGEYPPLKNMKINAKLRKHFGLDFNIEKPKGILPVFCRQHELLFMYDFDNKVAIKADSNDRRMLEKIKISMIKRQQRDNEELYNYKIY